jgi:hypothetical protein
MKYNYYLHIVPTLRRGNAVETLQRRVWQRWSVAGCIPTPERGNDAVSLFRQDGAES